MAHQTITCPNCGTQIDIDEIFYKQIEARFKAQQQQERKKMQAQLEEMAKARLKRLEEEQALKMKEKD